MNHSCPCLSGLAYSACCKPLLTKQKSAATAEALMRSRYTAYCEGDVQYLFKTWHRGTRPTLPSLRADNTAEPMEWLGLKVLRTEQSSNKKAVVEFVASYKTESGIGQLKELSHFVFEGNQWLYVNGE